MQRTLKQMPELAFLGVIIMAAGIFFSATDPATVPPVLFIVAFGLILAALFLLLRLLLRLTGLRQRLPAVRYYGLLAAGTILPVLLLALQSLGQLTVRDVLVLLFLFVAGYFYISRMYGRA